MISANSELVMPTQVAVDQDLLEKAKACTGLREEAALVREGLKALIERESARKLIQLGGSEPEAHAAPRRRPASA
jgi:Arc/MetJ family transcription regulator